MRRSKRFKDYLHCLRLPLLYSILALLSLEKVSLFNDRLLNLMEYLMVSEWNTSEVKADTASYILEHLAQTESFDYKENNDKNICLLFQKLSTNKGLVQEYHQSMSNPNLMRQRRVFVSPTLDIYQFAVEEESNRVLRSYKDYS